MSTAIVALWSVLGSLILLPGTLPPGAAQLRLTLATIHAAALTTPRASADSEDEPYMLVSVQGPGKATSTVHIPASAHLTVHQDEALGAQPLVTLSLQPGDSVRLLLSLLEGPKVELPAETGAAEAATKALGKAPGDRDATLAPALAPLTQTGSHWLGSVQVLITNESGSLYWRSFECVATCKVLNQPAGSAPMAPAAKPIAGVVELTGGGGTYHFQLQGVRVS